VIQQVATSGFVLVMSPSKSVLHQWAASLQSQGGLPTRFVTSDLALELASGSPFTGSSGILLATSASIRRGPTRAWLLSTNLALFVVDFVPPSPGGVTLRSVQDIVSRANQTIVVDREPGIDLPPWLEKPSVASLTLDELIAFSGQRPIASESYSVRISQTEHTIVQQATRLLGWETESHSRAAMRFST